MASPDPARLSLNTATVRERWNLAQMIEGCARHGIRGISPWRDKLAEMGLKQAARAIQAHGEDLAACSTVGGPVVGRERDVGVRWRWECSRDD